MVLIDILEKNARAFPNKNAVSMKMGYRTVALSYKDVYALATQISCLLEQQGVKKGDPVLLLGPNSPYWICIFWGILLRGAVVVPLTTQSTDEMVQKIAEQTEAKILFKSIYSHQALPAHLKLFDIEFIQEEVKAIDTSHFEKAAIRSTDLVEIMYTSGTTGDPKGVMLSNENILSGVQLVEGLVSLHRKDIFLSILPLSHIFEQVVGFLYPFKNGIPVVYAHSLPSIAELLKERHITKMIAVPEFLQLFMNKIEAGAKEQGKEKIFNTLIKISQMINIKSIQRLLFRSVHKKLGGRLMTVATGGAPLDKELEKKWNALGVDLLQGYGLTETAGIVSANAYSDRRMGSVGKALSGILIKIEKDREILVKGPTLFGGYFKNEDKTKEVFTPDGWFRTGDIGELDADGFLFIRGRKRYMILSSGGQNVHPEDIEFELNTIPGVEDSCVVGLPKSHGQVEIHAVLLSEKADIDGGKIIEKANQRLASYQHITGWSLWEGDDFPRSATRKVKKEEVLLWLRKKETESSFVRTEKVAKTPLMHLLSDITGTPVDNISDTTNPIRDLELDSLFRVELVARIEQRFGVLIDEAEITLETTVQELAERIAQAKPFVRTRFKKWPITWWARTVRSIGQYALFLYVRLFVNLRVENVEALKKIQGPVVFMPNHISMFDSVVMAMAIPTRLRKNISFAAAINPLYTKYKQYATLVDLLFNSFPFPREKGERIASGFEYMSFMLDRNYSVVIFPEGKISKDGTLQQIKSGAGLVATEMSVPIIPIKIIGTNDIVPEGKVAPRKKGTIIVRFGKPLTFSPKESYSSATEEIYQAMKGL